jgi:hypothetical protein
MTTRTATRNGQQTAADGRLQAKLKEEWDALVARGEEESLAQDMERAALLARYVGDGMTTRAIAACGLKKDKEGQKSVGKTHVARLLLYHEFLNSEACAKILPPPGGRPREGRFRAWWEEVSDDQTVGRLRRCKDQGPYKVYKAKVFRLIAEHIKADDSLHPIKRPPSLPKSEDIRTVRRVTKAARIVYDRLKPTLKSLRGLLHCDRSTFAPAVIAVHAQALDREIKELFRILAGVSVGEDDA